MFCAQVTYFKELRIASLRLANSIKEEAVQRDIRRKEYGRLKALERVKAEDAQLHRLRANEAAVQRQRAENAQHFLVERKKMRQREELDLRMLRFSADYYGEEKKKPSARGQKESSVRLACRPERSFHDDGDEETAESTSARRAEGPDANARKVISEQHEFMSKARAWLRGRGTEDGEEVSDSGKASVRFPQLV